METQSEMIKSRLWAFETVERTRKACQTRLAHLQRMRLCRDCGKNFMPKSFEPCPECGSMETRLMCKTRKCLDCQHKWIPNEIGNCSWCSSGNTVSDPKDDLYLRNEVMPRLNTEEEKCEKELQKVMRGHVAWTTFGVYVKGVGETSLARIVARCEIDKIGTVSAMWAHCGLGLYADGTRQRKMKGQTVDYSPRLQSACIMMGANLQMALGKFHSSYSRFRNEYDVTLQQGHAHNRAFRHMVKLFVSLLWRAWREALGLPAPLPYAFGPILNHTEGHLITPSDMMDKRPEPKAVRKRNKRGEPIHAG